MPPCPGPLERWSQATTLAVPLGLRNFSNEVRFRELGALMTKPGLITLALLAVLAFPSLARATVGPGDTRISVGREGVDGSAGKEHLAGKVVITGPNDWTRTSNDTAPTAKFAARSGGCSARGRTGRVQPL